MDENGLFPGGSLKDSVFALSFFYTFIKLCYVDKRVDPQALWNEEKVIFYVVYIKRFYRFGYFVKSLMVFLVI